MKSYPGVLNYPGVHRINPAHIIMTRTDTKQRLGPFRQQYETNRKIILATQTLCAICGKPVDKTLPTYDPLAPTVDHIIPIAKGGHPADLDNLQLAHRICNRNKSDKLLPDEPKEKQNFNRNLPHSRNWCAD